MPSAKKRFQIIIVREKIPTLIKIKKNTFFLDVPNLYQESFLFITQILDAKNRLHF